MMRTVPEALAWAAERKGAGFTFVGDDRSEDEWSFEKLSEEARTIAHALTERGLRQGDRVALILPTAAHFIPTFLGVIHGGGIPVPLYPPMGLGKLGGYLDHARHIVGAARARFVVTTGQIKAVLGKLRSAVPELEEMLIPADLTGDASLYRDPGIALEDTCFLQFTSGSTSRPKGVIVSHENLAHNAAAIMREGLSTDDSDRGISWLPLFHDMGLIGFVLAPIYHRVPVTFLSPVMFLKDPASWLEYISKHRGTITYGPNFAYALANKRVRDRRLEGLDLSCLRIAGCGAEPIQSDTLRAFAKRFAAYGFRENAFVPSYGMAEHTLAIAFSTGIPVDRVASEPLWSEGRADAAGHEVDDVVELVGCGTAFPGHEIRITDTDTGAVLSDRRVGQIECRGPSVMPGYFENSEATAATLTEDGWLRTGDLGYLADGHIYICGRLKDVLIVNGKNYYPQDLEWAASSVKGVRAGNVIAFAAHRPELGREAVVVVAETRETEGRDALADEVRAAIHASTGLSVDEVRIVDAGTIPKTSSGKVQRSKGRELFESDQLKKQEDEGMIRVAGRVVESQLAHLRLRIFGP